MPIYVGIAIAVVVIAVGIVITARRNSEIRKRGLEASATVTRIEEEDHTDADGSLSATTYAYYVTYRTQDGRTVEARLGSGKSVDNQIGAGWAGDLRVGSTLNVLYMPDKPGYVIPVRK